jgi:hypothetical protein
MRLGTKDDKVYKDILCGVDDGSKDDDPTQSKYNDYYGWVESSGKFANEIQKDILAGTLVAYVVKSEDNNINKPISRLLIKPYVNEKNSQDVIWVSSDKLYGQYVDEFKSSVDEWLGSWQGDDFDGLYYIQSGLYSDGKVNVILNKPFSKWTNDDKTNFLNMVCKGTWNINEKGEVDVDGSVYMVNMGLTEIPVKFGKVRDFNCHKNNLTTLKNCPDFVGGYFSCFDNKLTTLKNCPTSVGGTFNCSENILTSLEFAPTFVGGNFVCSYQKNGHIFKEDDVREVSDVVKYIYV